MPFAGPLQADSIFPRARGGELTIGAAQLRAQDFSGRAAARRWPKSGFRQLDDNKPSLDLTFKTGLLDRFNIVE